jgi:hypothetical protein
VAPLEQPLGRPKHGLLLRAAGLDTPQNQGGGLDFVGLIYFWAGQATTDIIFWLNPEENEGLRLGALQAFGGSGQLFIGRPVVLWFLIMIGC